MLNQRDHIRALDAPPENDLTIEQLAQQTGLTVRNIRSHRTAGLVSPPEVRNGVGYYGPEHVARLRVVRELQAEGFNLQAIKRLLDATHSPQSLLGFREVLFAPPDAESSVIMPLEELLRMLGGQATPESLGRAIQFGELIPLEDGRVEIPHPTLLEAVKELASQGMALDPALTTFEVVHRHCEEVAGAFVELFIDGIWKPFEEAGYPQERWPEITASIERLRPIASQVLVAIFQTQLTSAIETRLGQELERITQTAE